MRPARLELEGFTSFRERTVVDFEGVELFALSGPTGAGKSSVIDAMIFTLYGTVPRLGDERQVAPVVSQGRTQARVRLDFDDVLTASTFSYVCELDPATGRILNTTFTK